MNFDNIYKKQHPERRLRDSRPRVTQVKPEISKQSHTLSCPFWFERELVLLLVHPAAMMMYDADVLLALIAKVSDQADDMQIFLQDGVIVSDKRFCGDYHTLSSTLIRLYGERCSNLPEHSMLRAGQKMMVSHDYCNFLFLGFPLPELLELQRQCTREFWCGYASFGSDIFDLAKLQPEARPQEAAPVYRMLDEQFQYVSMGKPLLVDSPIIRPERSKIYTLAPQHEMLKTVYAPDDDYCPKLMRLYELGQYLCKENVLNTLPTALAYSGEELRGFTMKQLEGFTIFKMIGVGFDTLCSRFNWKNDKKNYYNLLQKIAQTVVNYHNIGIYFSDIKDDNFWITDKGEIVPIDMDGVSVDKFSCCQARPELLPEDTERFIPYFQTAWMEGYSFTSLVYFLLTGGIYPNNEEQPFVPAMSDPNSDPALQEIYEDVQALPAPVRDAFIKCFMEYQPTSAENWLMLLDELKIS